MWLAKDFLVTFRMYQMNFDGNAERVYSGYWDTAKLRFVEEGVDETMGYVLFLFRRAKEHVIPLPPPCIQIAEIFVQ